MLPNSFCAFFSFRAFVLVGFFLLHLEAVFTSARFSLTANVFHGALYLVLCFVGMYFAVASRVGHWRNSHIRHSEYVFLSSPIVHRMCFLILLYIYLNFSNILVIKMGSVIVYGGHCSGGIIRRLTRIFAVTIRWSEDTLTNKEYVTQFIALFFHFLFIKM